MRDSLNNASRSRLGSCTETFDVFLSAMALISKAHHRKSGSVFEWCSFHTG